MTIDECRMTNCGSRFGLSFYYEKFKLIEFLNSKFVNRPLPFLKFLRINIY